ncbi:hypothetical protein FA15DRAFT_346415 [Coprinopsis marcescibilis]|uniref:DUF7587 domain-containing protein n=1 Tax=Coprinopsis marcescibilis TaxID=230819 RepID=A0A5C3L9Z6_COPMA|nr:hypothetical protein FA15DRAFT_346415 [Coprinopsis marcescibilis]
MIPSPISEPAPTPLPQYGFGPDINFKTLVRNNRFLYRVYTPKERSPFADDTDPWFIAPKFDQLYARTPVEVSSAPIIDPTEVPYSDVEKHMDWTTKSGSPYLSTSFSFAWSIWEALRRYHQGMKKDVEIAVIDAQALSGRAATAVEMLRKSTPEERSQQYQKWHRFSNESQSVLIHGFIPGTAVLASIPLLAVLERLPSYLTRTKAQYIHGNPLDHVAWNYTDKKQSYRQFCQDMSTRFFNTSQEIRFRDATGGSLRLALTFLRPWFYRMIVADFNLAVSTLRDLAIIIAHWGGQWWAKDHQELNRILDSMTFTLGEELLQRIRRQAQDEEDNSRLQYTVDALERIIRVHETDRLVHPLARETTDSCQCASSPITPHASPKMRPRRTISMSLPGQYKGAPSFATPMTPPDSRRNSWSIPKESPGRQIFPGSVFQSFSPPADWPVSRARTPSLKGMSRSMSILSPLPATPDVPTLEIGANDEASTIPAVPAEESYDIPTTPVRSEYKELSVQDPITPVREVDDDTKALREAPRTPVQSERKELRFSETNDRPTVAFGLPTPPLESLIGLRARTLSDVSSNLRVTIPIAPTRLFEHPSPNASLQSIPSESALSSPRTLAPSSPQPLLKNESPLESTTLGSPIRLIGSRDLKGIDQLPPLPPSPAVSWGSAPTLPATPQSPSGSSSFKWPAKISIPLWTSPRRSLSFSGESSLTPVDASPRSSISRASLTDEAVKSPRPALDDDSPVLVTPVEDIKYITPRPGISLLATPLISADGVFNSHEHRRHYSRSHKPKVVETASYLVTGFVVGAFITLFLVSSQKRTLLYVT